MRIIHSLALVVALSALCGVSVAEDVEFEGPCDHNLPDFSTPVVPVDLTIVGAPIEPTDPSAALRSDPRNPGDVRGPEDARHEEGGSSVFASVSRWAGLPGDDETLDAVPTDPRRAAEERLVRRRAEAAAAREDCERARKALNEYRLHSLVGDDSEEFARMSNDLGLLEGIAIAATQAADEAKEEAAGLEGADEEEDGPQYQIWQRNRRPRGVWQRSGRPYGSRDRAEKEMRELEQEFPNMEFEVRED